MSTIIIRIIVRFLVLTMVATTIVAQMKEAEFRTVVDFERREQLDSAITFLSKILINQPNDIEALFHRGCCEFGLNKTEQAIVDLSKVIGLDSGAYIDAYYIRAQAYLDLKRYGDAMLDAEKLIKRDGKHDGALCLRGRIHSLLGHKKEACEDFRRAIDLGDQKATKYKNEYCGNEQGVGESLMLYWPEDENWKVANSQNSNETMLLELVRNNENMSNWTEMASMISHRGISKSQTTTEVVMKALYEQTVKHSSQAKLTVVERDDTAEFPWIIFSIEAPSYDDNAKPESWLWYVILGKDAIYTNFRAVHALAIPAELKTKWTNFFKTGKILYK